MINSENESQKYIETLYSEYIEKHIKEQERDELIYENNIEERDIKGYHGREILELLQNADDAYQKTIDESGPCQDDLEVYIQYKDNILTVSNTGTFFDKDGIKSIVQGNNSSKSGGYIGNKGTGFRSILNWANKVQIYSGEFNIEFSKEIAQKEFDAISSEKQIEKQLLKKNDLYIPMLSLPKNINGLSNNKKTIIKIEINPKALNDDFNVVKQIENLDLRILLFLPNIKKINILMENKEIIYQIDKEGVFCQLKQFVNNEIVKDEKFDLYVKKIENGIEESNIKKDILLAVAIPQNIKDFQPGCLYSFFPLLDTQSSFRCLMHASYILSDQRNTLIKNEINKTIVLKQLNFLIEVAEKYLSDRCHDIALNLLIPIDFNVRNWKFSSDFAGLNLEDNYLEMLANVKMLLTVNNEYVSINDNPKILKNDFPLFFVGENFSLLLKKLNSEVLQAISKLFNKSFEFSEKDLLSIINNQENTWSPEQHVELFDWWNLNYNNELPNLLKTQENVWLKKNEICYLLAGDFDKINIPKWVTFTTLNKEYQGLLFKKAECNIKIQKERENNKDHISRLISQTKVYHLINFTYRDKNSIIYAINSSVKTYDNAIDFVKWLWSNYRCDEAWSPPRGAEASPINYNFPTSGNDFRNANKLCFGQEYGNCLSEKLFESDCGYFASYKEFNIKEDELLTFKKFVSKFGVKDFPEVIKQEISPMCTYKIEYDEIIKRYVKGSCDVRYTLSCIENLEKIFERLSTKEVFKWINEDATLYGNLINQFSIEGVKIEYRMGKANWQTLNEDVKNYILFIFNNTKWIEIENKKYAPNQILDGVTTPNNQKFEDFVPVISNGFIENISRELKIDHNRVIKIIKNFALCDKVTDLCSEDFYNLMLNLPKYKDKSFELSKIIYRIIELPNFSRNYHTSESKRKFFKEGEVLVREKGNLHYSLAKEAYLPSTKMIDKKQYRVVEKGLRTNNDNFCSLFGCLQYNKEYSIVHYTFSKLNDNFQKYFNDFLKYASAYSERNENIKENIKKISISLVDSISIKEGENITQIVEEYCIAKDKGAIWYITSFAETYDLNKVSEAIETIFSNIANTPRFDSGKLGELFRAEKKEQKEFLIQKEFGTLDVVDDKFYENEIKNNFVDTLRNIKPDYTFDDIDINFNDFNCIENTIKIIDIFQKLNIDIEDFKNKGFVYSISFIPYYKKMLKNLIEQEKRKFKNILFQNALVEETKQQDFLDKCYEFENFENYVIDNNLIQNSIQFDIKDVLFKHFNYDFQTKIDIDCDKVYAANYQNLNPQKLFEDDIANNIKVKTLIYFNKIKDFERWIEKKQENNEKVGSNKSTFYLSLEGIIPQEEGFDYSSALPSASIDNCPKTKRNSYNKTLADRDNRSKKELGNKGELLIYNMLCEKYSKKNVFPRSEAFVELNILTNGLAVSGDYDLSYKDENGEEYFVEVKTSKEKLFFMSQGELDFAIAHTDKYKLYLVYDVDTDIPKYQELPNKFWEDEKIQRKNIVEKIEFKF